MSSWHRYYPPSRPREVKGGIRARSKHGAFGGTWWGRRWVESIERLDDGGRLDRGRRYARSGQVMSIDIDKGIVTARVQGSQATPYTVTITVPRLNDRAWRRLTNALAKEPLLVAQLLAGQMPEEIERVLTRVKLKLFPARRTDLESDCTCPDWANPCKHIAAVYYLLAEEFDRDPFLLFRLRGRERAEIIAETAPREVEGAVEALQEVTRRPEPMIAEASEFWGPPEFPPEHTAELDVPETAAALAHSLGGFPFWRGGDPMPDSIEEVYRIASEDVVERIVDEGELPTADSLPEA